VVENKSNPSPETNLLAGKTLHLALPVRWSFVNEQGRGHAEMACTYDVHPRGARLLSSREVHAGDVLLLERGRSKSVCQVVWVADSASPLRGQFTVQCVDEGRTPWDDELRQMEEQYQPVILDGLQRRMWATGFGRADQNRRRRPRFFVEGEAEVQANDGRQRVEGRVEQISEFGARIAAADLLRPGTDFRLMLNLFDISVALKAKVKYLVENLGMGVEFQEIRLGDRPLLNHVLSKLRTRPVEEFAPVEVEVVPGPLAVAG
jgi:hypothetical protein